MEDPPREHDKKNNKKTFPVTLNIGAGAGSFGIGGVVLLGGALVTATIVSAVAFKRRKQHRSSSENSDKNMSEETKMTGDGSNHLDLTVKSNKDFSVDPDLHNPSDGLTNMKEMQTKDIHDLVVDEKHDYGKEDDEQLDAGDGNEGVICLVAGEDQNSKPGFVDSVFESGELVCEEEVIVEVRNEDDSSKVLQRGVGGEEQRYLMPIDNENSELVEAKPLESDEVITSIGKYEAIEGVKVEKSFTKDITVEGAQDEECIGNDVAQAPEEENEEGKDQETVFMNEEAACIKQVIVEDNPQVRFIEKHEKESGYGDDEIIVENFKGDLINETGNAYEIVSELVLNKEEEAEEKEKEAAAAVDAECVRHVKGQNNHQLEIVEDEKEQDQQMQFSRQQEIGEEAIKAACVDRNNVKGNLDASYAVACTMNNVKVAYEDQTTQLMHIEEEGEQTAKKVEEQATIEDGSVKFDEKEKACEMPHVQLIEAAKVDDRTNKGEDNPPTNLTNKEEKVEETIEMIIEDESAKKDEIPHVESLEEDENDEEDVAVKTQVVSDESEDSSVKSKQAEPAPHAQSVEGENEEDVTVKTEVVPDELEGSYVKSMQEETTPYVQSVEGKNTEEDVTKTEVVPDEIKKSFLKSMQEEPAPEAKASNQNIEENTEKSGTTVGKVQNDSDLNNSIKEDEDSKSASMSVIELAKGRKEAVASEPWDLKLLTCSLLVSIWCLCHWYTQLPFPELSLVGSLLFVLILLGYRNRTTYLVKYA